MGNSGITTLYPFGGKNWATPSKLLKPPIKPCKMMIGVPSPASK